ncbi:MAG: hypothetical protein QXF76_04730 [Candidatus Anstonellales archaeon]
MTHIKKLTLRQKSGLLSELHSDTVMGHFCWRMLDKFGETKLKEFIELYNKKETPVFTISNGLLEKGGELFFPRPLIHLKNSEVNQKGKSKKEKMIDFLSNKDIKSINQLTTKQFNFAINGKIKELYESIFNDKIERPKFETDLRVSAEIDRHSLRAIEGRLFSTYPKFLDSRDTYVVFLIKVLTKEMYNHFHCEDVLKDVFEIGFGKKKSSGYGQFEVVGDITDYNEIKEPDNPNAFICLGNYLPSVSDNITNECYYDFIVKYGRLGEEKSLSENPFKKPLIMFIPGSIFKTSTKKEFYGKVTQSGDISEYDIEAINFGAPLTLNILLGT